MQCDITQLTLYWSEELSEQEAAQVEDHLVTCARCRKELGELWAMQELMTGVPTESAPRDFVAEVSRKADESKTLHVAFWRKPVVAYPAFGAIAMAAAILIVVMGPWFDKPPAVASVRHTTRTLYAKINSAHRLTSRQAAIRDTTNFRARAGQLARDMRFARRIASSRTNPYR